MLVKQKDALEKQPVFSKDEAAVIGVQIEKLQAELDPRQGPIEIRFYLLAMAVGLVMGGIQSLSRYTYSKLMPETKDTASYFTYYDLSEKIAIVIGMFSFGYIEEWVGMKYSILSLIIFFMIGDCSGLYSALAAQRRRNVV